MCANIQTTATGRLTPCLQKKIDKSSYLVGIHFSDTSTQSAEDRLKRAILHDLAQWEQSSHWKQGNPSKIDGKS